MNQPAIDSNAMKQVAIFGASGCGQGVMPLARQQWAASGEPHQLVFVDDHPVERFQAEWVEIVGRLKGVSS
jgi:hypothetical protein